MSWSLLLNLASSAIGAPEPPSLLPPFIEDDICNATLKATTGVGGLSCPSTALSQDAGEDFARRTKGGRHILQQQPRAHPEPGEHREAAGNGTIPSQKLWRFAHSPPPRYVKCSSTSTTYGKAALEQVGASSLLPPWWGGGRSGGDQ